MAVDFRAIFSAQDKVSSTLNGIDKSGSGLTSTFKKLAGAAAGVFTAAKVVQFGKESISAFTNFESGMNEVFTLLPGISGDAMDEMSQQVKDFAEQNGVLTDEAIPAVYQAISAGVSKDNVFDFLTTANKAAVGGVTNLETAVDGLTTVVNSYGSDAMDVNTASDLMFTTVKLGKTTFEELSASLYNVLPTASSAGISFQDVSAALATITSQGVPTATATTQLRQAFVELSDTGSDVGKTFKTVAGKSFKEFIASGGNTQDALQLLEQYAQKSNVGINELFSSVEAGNAALSLTGNATDKFSDALEEMGAASGATDTAFAKMEESFARKLDKLKAKFDVLKVNIGDKLVGVILKIWDAAEPVFSSLQDAVGNIADLFKNFGFSGAIEQLFGADAGEIAGMAEDYAKSFIGGWQKIFSGDIAGGATDILTAMGFDDTSIGMITDFVSSVQSNLQTLASFIQPIIGTIKDAFLSILPTLQGIQNFFVQTLLPIFQDVFNFIVNNIIVPFIAYWQANIPKIASIFNNVWAILQPIFSLLAAAFTFIWNAAKPIISGLVQLITGFGTTVFTILDGITTFLAGVFTGNWSKAWEGVKEMFSGIWSGIVGLFKLPINTIITGINSFLSGLNSIKIPDWVPLVGGKGFNIPQIPLLAKGTFDAPNTFIAGEKGPELITGAQGSRVFPSDETGRIMSALDRANQPIDVSDNPVQASDDDSDSDGAKTFNININGSGQISGKGMTEDEVLEIMIVHLKPILMKIIKAEIYEEGNASYEF